MTRVSENKSKIIASVFVDGPDAPLLLKELAAAAGICLDTDVDNEFRREMRRATGKFLSAHDSAALTTCDNEELAQIAGDMLFKQANTLRVYLTQLMQYLPCGATCYLLYVAERGKIGVEILREEDVTVRAIKII